MKNKGFTIIEMLTASTVASILIILIMTFTANTLVSETITSAKTQLLMDAQLAMDALAKDIRLSATVDSENRWPDENAPEEGDEYSWLSDDSTLVLATAATDNENNVIFSDALHYITFKNNNIYFVQDGTLYKRVLAADTEDNDTSTTCPVATPSCPADRRLADGVTNFTVSYHNSEAEIVDPVNARSVEVSISLQQEKYGQQITADYTTRSVFRNE